MVEVEFKDDKIITLKFGADSQMRQLSEFERSFINSLKANYFVNRIECTLECNSDCE